MERKYVIVRANSTSGPFIIERNADIAGYADTRRAAEALAREANDSGAG